MQVLSKPSNIKSHTVFKMVLIFFLPFFFFFTFIRDSDTSSCCQDDKENKQVIYIKYPANDNVNKTPQQPNSTITNSVISVIEKYLNVIFPGAQIFL